MPDVRRGGTPDEFDDMKTMLTQLAELRDALAQTEEEHFEAVAKLDAVLAVLPERKEADRLRAMRKVQEDAIEQCERAVRAVALDEYAKHQDKAPAPGVTIKTFKRLQYEALAVTVWCRKNAVGLLNLDVKRFEKVATALECPHVTEVEEPRAYISSDLRSYLEE